jgi:hypothetical protein
MLQFHSRKTKVVALLTGGVIMASAMATTTAPAQAADKEKLYKGGAVALGVLGGYWLLKGKTLPGAAAAVGAYYAYKKGKQEDDRYSDNNVYPDSRYSVNTNRNNERISNNTYPDYRAPQDYGYAGMDSRSGSGSTLVLK